MAELDVQPKKKSSLWPLLLLGLALVALLIFLARGCNDDDAADDNNTVVGDTTAYRSDTAAATGGAVAANWDSIDWNAPAASYDEVTDRNVEVRGNESYGIYSLGESVLFDEGKSTLKSSAAANLKQIAESINRRYNGGQIRIYGYTDATGSAGANKQLAEQRAEAVRSWMTQNANIGADRISLHPVGEARPAATNTTAEGRKQNRRVEIVARRA